MARHEDLCLDDVLLWAEGLNASELRHTIAWLEKVIANNQFGYDTDKDLTKRREKLMKEVDDKMDEGWVPNKHDLPFHIWAKVLAEIDPDKDTAADIEENLRDALDSIKTEPDTYTLAVANQFAWEHRYIQSEKETDNE